MIKLNVFKPVRFMKDAQVGGEYCLYLPMTQASHMDVWSDLVRAKWDCYCGRAVDDEVDKIDDFLTGRINSGKILNELSWMSTYEIKMGLGRIIDRGSVRGFRSVCDELVKQKSLNMPILSNNTPYVFIREAGYSVVNDIKYKMSNGYYSDRDDVLAQAIKIAGCCLSENNKMAARISALIIFTAADYYEKSGGATDYNTYLNEKTWCRHAIGWFDDHKYIIHGLRKHLGENVVKLIKKRFVDMIEGDPISASWVGIDPERFDSFLDDDVKCIEACFKSIVINTFKVDDIDNNVIGPKAYMYTGMERLADLCSPEIVSDMAVKHPGILEIDTIRQIHEKYLMEKISGGSSGSGSGKRLI